MRQVIQEFISAGFGGTSNMVTRVISSMEADPQMIPVFKKDPEAFMLEAIRMWGGGGGGSVWYVNKTTTWTLGSGTEFTEPKGSMAMANLYASSYDPNVFGGPSKDPGYARKFLPGRENSQRILTWMNELQDIRKCPNMTGCEAAPRFCPGAELSNRLGRQMTEFYIQHCTGGKSKDEM